jgi:ABC-2 type transport system ATP-binding protein
MASNLRAAGVSLRYGWRWALRGVDISLEKGNHIALLGANGSGKSTLLRVLAGLLRPSEGEVVLDGESVSTEDRARIGLLSHDALFYPSLTLRENLYFFGKLYALDPARVGERVSRFTKGLGIADRLDDQVQFLSQGLRQRAALARTMLHEPEFFLLDEPFAGLDPVAASGVEAIIRDFSVGAGFEDSAPRSLLLTEHDIPRALSLADEIVVLSSGKISFHSATRDTSVEQISSALAEEFK